MRIHIEIKGYPVQYIETVPDGLAGDIARLVKKYLRYGNEVLLYQVRKEKNRDAIYIMGMGWKEGKTWYWGSTDKKVKHHYEKGRFVETSGSKRY